ncbi:MAG TPA: alpha/beta hydrolase [Blastocatellia bacterium]|nr:alpha/beta hydrolase [Blastocatellia bacterium]
MSGEFRGRRAIRIILKSAAVTLLTAIAAGIVYEEVGRRQDGRRLPQIGRSIDIGGRALNIYCSGEGGPAVILDSGAGQPGYAWSHIQPGIARFTRACWYDRAGEGWSDPGPFPRTSAASAKDLHELLQRAGVPPPYILVGHSLGGLNVRVYNGLYPGEVAGMVLVDSAHEDEPKRAPKFMLGPTLPRPLWYPLHLLVRATARVGLVRLMTTSAPLPEDASQRTREQIVEALRRQPKSVATSAGDATSPESYAQARSAAGLGDRPLIVLTRGRPPSPSGDPEMDRQIAAYEQVWMHEMQPQLTRLSTRGRQVIVGNSGHGIPDEAPDAVLNAIREVVMIARAPRASSP